MPNKSISFTVQGDSGSDYDMDLLVDHDACRLVCSCPAGSIGMFCKHKQRILDGDFSRADISAADKREAKQILDQLNSRKLFKNPRAKPDGTKMFCSAFLNDARMCCFFANAIVKY